MMQRPQTVRLSGIASSREEMFDGIVAIGVLIFGAEAMPVAALSVALPSIRFTCKHERSIIAALRSAAQTFSQELGHVGQPVRRAL